MDSKQSLHIIEQHACMDLQAGGQEGEGDERPRGEDPPWEVRRLVAGGGGGEVRWQAPRDSLRAPMRPTGTKVDEGHQCCWRGTPPEPGVP